VREHYLVNSKKLPKLLPGDRSELYSSTKQPIDFAAQLNQGILQKQTSIEPSRGQCAMRFPDISAGRELT
jgi:hypothetical protein